MDTAFLHPLTQEPDMRVLLAPVSPTEPCGADIRYDPVFTNIRLAREEDDATLPMRQWERPLRRADWPRIETLCRETLIGRSKDLQLSCWLLEAWTRQQGLQGLLAGLVLNRALLSLYGAALHPRADDEGDVDARLAPLLWLNQSIPGTLKVHIVLVPLVASKPNRISLAQWEKLTLQELAGKSEKTEAKTADVPGAGDSPLQRELVLANVRSHSLQWVRQQLDSVEQCTRELQLLEAWLDQQSGAQSVRLSRLAQELRTFDRVYRQMLSMVDAPADEPAGHVQVLPKADLMAPSTPLGTFDLQPSAAGPEPDTDGSDRAQVYERLGQLADYLARVEPHSPTPYLVRRAVQWGQMSLPEVMDEFIREDGDLKRFRSFILSQPRADKPGT